MHGLSLTRAPTPPRFRGKGLCALTVAFMLGALAAGCGGDSATPPPAPIEDTDSPDTRADDVATDITPPHETGDEPQCVDGEWRCSEDAHLLTRCVDGVWTESSCIDDEGRLCEEGTCKVPWHYGAPEWSDCPDEPLATPESLAEKAAYYDEIAMRLHVHPDLKWLSSVRTARVEVDCPEGREPPCFDAIRPETELTWADVEVWIGSGNDGLWSALYLASQAYRYAVTREPEALANLRLLMEGTEERHRITGSPGIFARRIIPPGVQGLSCPTADSSFTTSEDKDRNKWVRIGEDGCAWVIPHETGEWTQTDNCGLDDFVDWCFLDNVSQDEYAGHMYALGTVVKLVDDPDLRETATRILEQVAEHLMENDMVFVDWDGRPTEYGKMYPTSFVEAPGFAAVLGYTYVQMGAYLSGRDDLDRYRRECLLRSNDSGPCMPWPFDPGAYPDHLAFPLLYVGPNDCMANFNNFSMLLSGYYTAIGFEEDPALRAVFQDALDQYVMRDPDARIPAITQQNAWFNFIWASRKALGPQSDGPAYDAVHDAICSLRQFPASQAQPEKTPSATHEEFCIGRLETSMSEDVIPVAERCPRRILWWRNPYQRRDCEAEPWMITSPGDYLLAYWMGRYYGFLGSEL